MAKKRKDPPQATTRTLHHFFAGGASKATPPPNIVKRSRSDPVVKVESHQVEEIIVIDSDEEENVPERPPVIKKSAKARGKERASSSDIEVLEFSTPTSRTILSPSFKENNAQTTRRLPKREESVSKLDNVIDLDDFDWENTLNDDDLELIQLDPEDEGVDEIVGDMSETLERTPGECCPLCSVGFVGWEAKVIQEHVNSCIDSQAYIPSSSTSSTLKPLSSYRPEPSPFPSSSSKLAIKTETMSTKSTSGNVFSVLMSSHDEKAAWEEAQQAEDRNIKPTKANRRNAPFYKVLQGMPIAVDAFRYGAIPNVTAYFLTHAHSDHYTNLSSNWKNGYIYCSETTANLVIHMLSVDKKWVKPLPMNIPTVVPNTGGVTVTLIEANHCPGSCLFLFEGKQTVNAGDSSFKSNFIGTLRIFRYLHCGDFRACPQHVLHPAVKGKKIDTVYLDTTYLNPKYCFPPQPQVVSACAELVRRIAAGEHIDGTPPDTGGLASASLTSWFSKTSESTSKACDLLVVVGTYSIGKERIVKGIAKSLNSKIFCDSRKTAIMRCEDDDELLSMLTNDPCNARVHVVPLGTVSSDRLGEYIEKLSSRKDSSRLKWDRVIAFRPTGWTFTPPAGMDMSPSIAKILARDMTRAPFTYAHLKPIRANAAPVSVKSKITVYGVPYSEHSSFFELTCFALSFEWVRMIATVNVGSAASRAKISSWVGKWEKERDRRKAGGEPAVVPYRSEDYW